MADRPVAQERPSDRTSTLWQAIAVVFLAFTYGLCRNPLAALLAPVFLIRFMRGRKAGAGYVWVLLALVAADIVAWWQLMPTLPAPARIIFGAVVGFMYSIPFVLDRVLVGRFRGFASTLVFPLASAGFEFLTIWPNPVGHTARWPTARPVSCT